MDKDYSAWADEHFPEDPGKGEDTPKDGGGEPDPSDTPDDKGEPKDPTNEETKANGDDDDRAEFEDFKQNYTKVKPLFDLISEANNGNEAAAKQLVEALAKTVGKEPLELLGVAHQPEGLKPGKPLDDMSAEELQEFIQKSNAAAAQEAMKQARREFEKELAPIKSKAEKDAHLEQITKTVNAEFDKVNLTLAKDFAGYQITRKQMAQAIAEHPTLKPADAVWQKWGRDAAAHGRTALEPKGGKPLDSMVPDATKKPEGQVSALDDPVAAGEALARKLGLADDA